jgi:hypothetical protein
MEWLEMCNKNCTMRPHNKSILRTGPKTMTCWQISWFDKLSYGNHEHLRLCSFVKMLSFTPYIRWSQCHYHWEGMPCTIKEDSESGLQRPCCLPLPLAMTERCESAGLLVENVIFRQNSMYHRHDQPLVAEFWVMRDSVMSCLGNENSHMSDSITLAFDYRYQSPSLMI